MLSSILVGQDTTAGTGGVQAGFASVPPSTDDMRVGASPSATATLTPRLYLPLITRGSCDDIPGERYDSLSVLPPPTDRPAEEHADLNLALRGYVETTGALTLVDYPGPADPKAPQLYTLFGDQRVPTFLGVYQVYDWNWDCNCRAAPIDDPPVTLVGAQMAPDEIVHVPASGYNIGTAAKIPPRGYFVDRAEDDPNAYEVLVLYAGPERITLKYTREDNVKQGYTLHIEQICVAPSLLALYRQRNAEGRAYLPALKAGQGFGRASGEELGIVIRDTGSFMDPRSRKDWWQGK